MSPSWPPPPSGSSTTATCCANAASDYNQSRKDRLGSSVHHLSSCSTANSTAVLDLFSSSSFPPAVHSTQIQPISLYCLPSSQPCPFVTWFLNQKQLVGYKEPGDVAAGSISGRWSTEDGGQKQLRVDCQQQQPGQATTNSSSLPPHRHSCGTVSSFRQPRWSPKNSPSI